MIKLNETKGENYWTEGFETTNPSPMSLEIQEGSITIENSITEYEAFSFEVFADLEFMSIYDVYLVNDGTVHVDRTVMGADTIAHYEGDAKLLFMLMSFVVPANTTDLNVVEINVKNVVKL